MTITCEEDTTPHQQVFDLTAHLSGEAGIEQHSLCGGGLPCIYVSHYPNIPDGGRRERGRTDRLSAPRHPSCGQRQELNPLIPSLHSL